MSATKLRGRERQETMDNVSLNIESEYSGPTRSFKTQNSSQLNVKQFARRDLFFFEPENLFEVAAERAREPECELERRRIFFRFERYDRLPCDAAEARKFRLRHRGIFLPPAADFIAYRG
ncbi:MAG TPA: hypothetical protein VEW08_04575, partial [Steroidobacteraceae bacterium]|nr:hypothetical protein [Steroidobacteraceae bacterium]